MGKRFPVQIGNWEVSPRSYSIEGLIKVLDEVIEDTLKVNSKTGVLLSGGVDSCILALLCKRQRMTLSCFTIGLGFANDDVIAAQRFAKEQDLDLHIFIPSTERIERTHKDMTLENVGVYLILEAASQHIDTLFCTDGIDELMGGYWQHFKQEGTLWNQYGNVNMVFKHFWDELQCKHLNPMWDSARRIGINLEWIFLHPLVLEYISRIPLEDRISKGRKSLWKKLGTELGLPEWILVRKKRGFCDALR